MLFTFLRFFIIFYGFIGGIFYANNYNNKKISKIKLCLFSGPFIWIVLFSIWSGKVMYYFLNKICKN